MYVPQTPIKAGGGELDNSYVIDPSGLILSVGPNWDRYAIESGAPGAASKHVVGRKWWEFVVGQQTRSYLNAVFFACRMDHQKFSIRCRCDEPDEKALYQLSVIPHENDTLSVNLNQINDLQPSNNARVIDFTECYDTVRCSICCSFLLGENWIDPFSQHDVQFFAQNFDICPACRKQALAKIHKSNNKQKLAANIVCLDADTDKPNQG